MRRMMIRKRAPTMETPHSSSDPRIYDCALVLHVLLGVYVCSISAHSETDHYTFQCSHQNLQAEGHK